MVEYYLLVFVGQGDEAAMRLLREKIRDEENSIILSK